MSSVETMKAWAQLIKSYDEVPGSFKDFVTTTLLSQTTTFPYMVLTPSYEGFLHRTTAKLVCSIDDKIYVAEKSRDKLAVTCFKVTDVNYVEVGSILLKSWIKISGITETGLATSTFKFSAVTLGLFRPIIEKVRQSASPAAETTDLKAERSKFNHLINANFKFMNYARKSILPGEKVICTVLQPEIRVKLVELFHKPLLKTISMPHISILTNQELILIRDDAERWTRDTSYGGIWSYIPLQKITAVALSEAENDTLSLEIQMPANDKIGALFSVANKPEVTSLFSQFQGVTPALAAA